MASSEGRFGSTGWVFAFEGEMFCIGAMMYIGAMALWTHG
jgi:hypothetical protein